MPTICRNKESVIVREHWIPWTHNAQSSEIKFPSLDPLYVFKYRLKLATLFFLLNKF